MHQRRAREAKPKGLRQDEEDEHVQVLQEVRQEVWQEVQQDPWQWRCQQAQGLGQVVVVQEEEELEEEEQKEEAAKRAEGQQEEGESQAKGCKDTSGGRKNKTERVCSGKKYYYYVFLTILNVFFPGVSRSLVQESSPLGGQGDIRSSKVEE